LFENTAFLMAQHMVGSSMTGEAVPPMPARESAWAIYELFETAAGEPLFIGITSDNHWRRFCDRFGRQDLLEDARFGSNEDRVRERPVLVPIVAEIVKRHDKEEMIAVCEEIGIPFAPVATIEDLFDDPHLNAGGRLVEVELPGGIRTRLPKLPIEIGSHDLTLRMQPPALGEHTREVLAGIGLSELEISHLEAEGVVKCAAPPGAVD
jgi:crotonobetainyl-CoA:carnitine CoA-transferase CaiB-like acyl-CoA transferase